MSFGGGNFTTQNKVLPGTYVNVVSGAYANAKLSERGIATMPLELDWGVEGEVYTVTAEDFCKKSSKIFGYDYTHEKMKGLRDLFLNIHTLYAYRLNQGGEKAQNDFATAKYSGIRGNDLQISIQADENKEELFHVRTLLDTVVVDEQTVSKSEELTENDFVSFKEDAVLAVTAASPLTGGTNGKADTASYQSYADRIESYTYNAMGIVTTDETVGEMFATFNRRMRDDTGIRFQLVMYHNAADYMGVVNVKNKVTDPGCSPASLVYWVTGIMAGCAVNKSCENMVYNGEYQVDTAYTQSDLIDARKAGEFVLHRADSTVRVLADINSMVTVSEECGEIFKENQTVRVIDKLANDDALLFNTKYLGIVPNDVAGRISLWSDLVKIRQALNDQRAIENFKDSDVTVEQGESKRSVVVTGNITVVNAMSQLYMTTTVY